MTMCVTHSVGSQIEAAFMLKVLGGVCKQLCVGVQAAVWWVAHKILETAQSPNSSFPFLFDFGLGLGT